VQRSIFGPALDDGLIVRNPAAKVQASGTAPKQRQALSAGDLARLRAHVAGDRLGAVWWLTLPVSDRSEILALTWADLDLSAGMVTVSRSITADASGRRGAPTGT
jgi:integrase